MSLRQAQWAEILRPANSSGTQTTRCAQNDKFVIDGALIAAPAQRLLVDCAQSAQGRDFRCTVTAHGLPH